MKSRKTYGIKGLLEWYGCLHFGNNTMKVSFTNGSVTAYGVSPATYTTDNAFTQYVIENSEEFKGGRIFIVRQFEIPGDDPIADNGNANVAEPKQEETNESASENKNVTKVEVADKNEAIEYLKEHFGAEYTATRLRTKSAFDSACESCGVEFVFAE